MDDARDHAAEGTPGETSTTRYLEYQPPYSFAELLRFFGTRAIAGVEAVTGEAYVRTARIEAADGSVATGWLRVEDAAARNALAVTVSESLREALPHVAERVRRQFDLDNDPHAVSAGLSSMAEISVGLPHEGTRLPGCFDPFETVCRAVIGQQITVKAASNIAGRIAAALGAPLGTGIEGLDRAWPSPAEILALPDPETAFGEQGLIKSRTRAIVAIARLIESGALTLGSAAPGSAAPGASTLGSAAPADEQMRQLLAVKGIGPWTANYIAMRAFGHTDAFLETDVGVAHALPDLSPAERVALAEQWRPWRSYAVINLWNSLDES